jgi:glutamate racemase
MKIGFFDSGIGGITVLYQALKILPKEDYLYYADTMQGLYAKRPMTRSGDSCMKRLISASQNTKAIVIAVIPQPARP